MKVRKVNFGSQPVKTDCRRELLERKDIPVCVKRTGNTIHTDFRPYKPQPSPTPSPPTPSPQPTPSPSPSPQPTPSPSPPTPSPSPSPQPTPQPSPPSLPAKNYTTEIVAGTVGTAGAVGALVAGLSKTTSVLPEIVPEVEMTGSAFAGELSIDEATGIMDVVPVSSFEIAGESVAVAGEVAGGVASGLVAGASAVAMGAVATVGALAVFTEGGLFDFASQASSFQKGAYNTQQEVQQRQPPQMRYIEPPPMFASTFETLDYFRRRDQAEADYQTELSAYNSASSPSP